MPYCIQCGALNPDVAKFCSSCGAAMTTSNTSSSEPPRQQQAQKTVTNPAATALQQTVKTQAPVVQQPYTNPIPPAQAPPSNQRLSVIRAAASHPATGGALLVLIGFFLPWAAYYDYTYDYTPSSINGFTFAKQFMAQSAFYKEDGVKAIATLIGISLYIVVAAAGFFLLSSILDPKINGLTRLVRFVPFLVFAGIILLIAIASASTGQKMASLSGMKIGLYLCFAGSFLMLFLSRRV